MTRIRLRYYLITSTLIHLTLLVVLTTMVPTTPVVMHAVEAFIIESPVSPTAEPNQLIPLKAGIALHAEIHETGQTQPIQHERKTAPSLASMNGDMQISSAYDAPEVTALPPVARMASAVRVTPLGSSSVHPQKEAAGSAGSIPARQSSETGQVMVLGDVGSPRFIHRESPVYPFVARKLGKEGRVILRLALDAQGQLQRIDPVETTGFGFAEAASTAIRKSIFAPAVKNGRAVSSQVLVPVRFVLTEAL